jgi:hypothetical protein
MSIANHRTTADHSGAIERATDAGDAPIADVYTGDIAPTSGIDAPRIAPYVFTIEAEAGPGTFARIANVLGIANVAPSRVVLELDKATETLHIDAELCIGPQIADSLRRKLCQLTDVTEVDMATPS